MLEGAAAAAGRARTREPARGEAEDWRRGEGAPLRSPARSLPALPPLARPYLSPFPVLAPLLPVSRPLSGPAPRPSPCASSLLRSLPFFSSFLLSSLPLPPPFREMSSLEGGFSPGARPPSGSGQRTAGPGGAPAGGGDRGSRPAPGGGSGGPGRGPAGPGRGRRAPRCPADGRSREVPSSGGSSRGRRARARSRAAGHAVRSLRCFCPPPPPRSLRFSACDSRSLGLSLPRTLALSHRGPCLSSSVGLWLSLSLVLPRETPLEGA